MIMTQVTNTEQLNTLSLHDADILRLIKEYEALTIDEMYKIFYSVKIDTFRIQDFKKDVIKNFVADGLLQHKDNGKRIVFTLTEKGEKELEKVIKLYGRDVVYEEETV